MTHFKFTLSKSCMLARKLVTRIQPFLLQNSRSRIKPCHVHAITYRYRSLTTAMTTPVASTSQPADGQAPGPHAQEGKKPKENKEKKAKVPSTTSAYPLEARNRITLSRTWIWPKSLRVSDRFNLLLHSSIIVSRYLRNWRLNKMLSWKVCLWLSVISHMSWLDVRVLIAQPRDEIVITMPDGSERKGLSWETSPMDVAKEVSKSLSERIVIAKVRKCLRTCWYFLV